MFADAKGLYFPLKNDPSFHKIFVVWFINISKTLLLYTRLLILIIYLFESIRENPWFPPTLN